MLEISRKVDTNWLQMINYKLLTILLISLLLRLTPAYSHSESFADSSTWEYKINAHPTLKSHLSYLSENGCYIQSYVYQMPGMDDVVTPKMCDSVRNVSVNEMNNLFSNGELYEVLNQSDSYYTQLISFEALTRSTTDSDSLIQWLDLFYTKNLSTYYFFPFNSNNDQLYRHMLETISPFDTLYKQSNKIGLEQYTFLASLISNYEPSWFTTSRSFYVKDTINFGTIDLSNFTGNQFELHGRIKVVNVSDQLTIIAPYHDNFTKFDKKSYRLKGREHIEIDFNSVVKLETSNKEIKRLIRIVDYQTKDEKLVWIKANFVNFKN